MRHAWIWILVLSMAVAGAACAKAERQRPLPIARVDKGQDSMEAVRQALAGRWVLVSLHVTAADGRPAQVEATGALTSDAFGVLTIEYRMSEAGQKALETLGITAPNPVLSTSGRVVIDPRARRITYIDDATNQRAFGFDPAIAARRANPFTLERARYYAFGEDSTLRLATRHDNGRDAAVSVWKKEP